MSGLIGGATADRLRPIALKTCKDVIGYEEGSIVAAATQCIGTVSATCNFLNCDNYHFSPKFHKRKSSETVDPISCSRYDAIRKSSF